MADLELESLHQKMELLQRRVRWYNGLILAFALIVLVYILVGIIGYPPVETYELRVLNEIRAPIVTIGDRGNGDMGVWIQRGTEPYPNLFLGFKDGDTPMLIMTDETGVTRRITIPEERGLVE